MKKKESLSSAHIIAAAKRVRDEHQLRLRAAAHAQGTWERHQTLSAAIQRDDAKKALFALSDANTLALAILAAEEHQPTS